MTTEIVNTETGEILETISADEARRLTTEAQNEFRSSREHFDRAWSLIEQAVEGGGHVALGYRSPGDYLHAEFDGVLAGIDVASRRTVVRTMTGWGLSNRAIAAPLGVSHVQVIKDRASGGNPVTTSPEPTFISATDALAEMNNLSSVEADELPAEESESIDSGPMSGTADTIEEPGADAVSSDSAGEEDEGSLRAVPKSTPPAPPAPSNVIGIDGKTYKRPEKKAPRRRPLPDAARDAGWELRKSVERLERIAADDRFAANKDQVAAHLRGHLNHAIEVCQDLLDRVNEI